VENFKCLGVVFTCDGRWNKEIDTRIGEANAVLRELYRSVFTKRKLSNTAKLSVFESVFIPILTYDHDSWVMTERIPSQSTSGRDGILRKVRSATLRDKVHSCDNLQSPECQAAPPNREIPDTSVRACVQNPLENIGETSPAGYTHGKAAQRLTKNQTELLHFRPCLVPSWCGASRTIWNRCWSWGISSPPRDAVPTTHKRGKAGVKINERMFGQKLMENVWPSWWLIRKAAR